MNISFSSLKNIFHKKHGGGTRIPLSSIALAQIVVGVILLVLALGFDIWVYHTKVARSTDVAAEDIHGVAALNVQKLTEASDSIKASNEFILKPSFPLIRSPF